MAGMMKKEDGGIRIADTVMQRAAQPAGGWADSAGRPVSGDGYVAGGRFRKTLTPAEEAELAKKNRRLSTPSRDFGTSETLG